MTLSTPDNLGIKQVLLSGLASVAILVCAALVVDSRLRADGVYAAPAVENTRSDVAER